MRSLLLINQFQALPQRPPTLIPPHTLLHSRYPYGSLVKLNRDVAFKNSSGAFGIVARDSAGLLCYVIGNHCHTVSPLHVEIIADAKTLMEAIEKRFGGNTETKKVQKTLLKQQFENFSGSISEGLDQIHDRLQKLVSQLELHGRNKTDLEDKSLDDLFNSLKIYESEVKHSSSLGTASPNLAFVSTTPASRIRLFIKGKTYGRMMLDSIDNGPLVYPTIKENGHTRPKKYSELAEAQQLQDDCDVQAINIILYDLPPDVYALVNHQETAKDIWDRVKLLMKGTKLSYQERDCRLYNLFDKFAYVQGETLYEYY
nr:hypothetical protein [Tanacetum cinerariifolium]